jgi:arylsulfatase
LLSQYDKIGTEFTSPNYPLGWSQAANTPFRYWKSDANSEGATHNPMVIHYPKGINEKGTIRAQYSHVIDILPTTVELTGVKVPEVINGYPQLPIQGTSLVYTLSNPNAPTKHTVQYYELHGGRSIYKDGWKAAVYHPRNYSADTTTTDINFVADFKKDRWELYHLSEDWTETNDLAAKDPRKLEELKTLFDSLAVKYNVFPLKNYKDGVPSPVISPKSVIYEGTTIKTRVYIGKGPVSITANIEVPEKNAEGVIFANGGLLGGTVLYMYQGKLLYTLNDGIQQTTLIADKPLTAGKHAVKADFAADGTVTLLLDNERTAEQKISGARKYLNTFSSEGVSVGRDLNSPVLKIYGGTFPFTGAVKTLIIEQSK